jgi:hypothetical protein
MFEPQIIHTSKPIIARCTVSTAYWFQAALMLPLTGLILTAVLIMPVLEWLGIALQGPAVIYLMVGVSLVTAIAALGYDYFYTYWALTEDALILRRGFAREAVPFNDIRSIYTGGLPEQLPWYVRINRYNPKGRAAYQTIVLARKSAFLLKLTQQRLLPLTLTATGSYQGGADLMLELYLLNEQRVIETHVYTEESVEEKAFLSTRGYNKIVQIPSQAIFN